MDEFGVLVESIGFKAQGRSAPLADLKNKRHVDPPKSAYNSGSSYENTQIYGGGGGFDDVFGGFGSDPKTGVGGFDLDSVFRNSNKSSGDLGDDIFGGVPAQHGGGQVDDFFGDFVGGFGLGSNGSRSKSEETKTSSGVFDDLIPGFSGISPIKNSRPRENKIKIRPPPSADRSSRLVIPTAGDPFIVLEQSSSHNSSGTSKPNGQATRKESVSSAVDEFEDFVMGGQRKYSNDRSDIFQTEGFETNAHDLDFIFNMGPRQTNASRDKPTASDPIYDSLFQNKSSGSENRAPTVRKTSETSTSMKKASSGTNFDDDFSLFFGEANPSSGEFQEVEGESAERRRARMNHHIKTQERMAKALAEKNQRDLQTQREQEERHRIAESQNDNIKRWAAGKEGNLRALLSSLQHVLWPECGWHPVSLTDLITSVSVKKVYHRATLCVHPDKVQQKSATVQQKYIAEKVFDLLKEAWNKFNAEELR